LLSGTNVKRQTRVIKLIIKSKAKQNTVPIGLALLEHTVETYSVVVKFTAIVRYG